MNPSTGTIYVASGTNGTLSLIDAKTCNSDNVSGCKRQVVEVTAGTDPIGVAIDASTNMVYVANASGTVTVVNGRKCYAGNISICPKRPTTLQVGANPQFLTIDPETKTLYVANTLSNTVSVIDARSCNPAPMRACGRVRAVIPVGPEPFALAVDDRTDSIYVTDLGGRTVSIIDGHSCNSTITKGCLRHPAIVNVGRTPGGIAINRRTDTIYVTGEFSNDVSVIDDRICNARTVRGCQQKPTNVRTGSGPRGIAVNETTDTVYVANTVGNTVSVIDGASCNARVHSGCSQPVVEIPVGSSPRRLTVDEETNTIYVTNAWADTVTMLDGRTCSGRVHSGCGRSGTPGAIAPGTTTTQATTGPRYTASARNSARPSSSTAEAPRR